MRRRMFWLFLAVALSLSGCTVPFMHPGETPRATVAAAGAADAADPLLPSEVTPADDKAVYLAFDDGPSLKNTLAILDTLDQYGIKATFFVVGTSMEKYPYIVREIHRRGRGIVRLTGML